MIERLIQELESGNAVSLDELAAKLALEPSALLAMIQTLVMMGKISDDNDLTREACANSACGACAESGTCALCQPLATSCSAAQGS